jgi:hypothetical protein
MSMIKWALPLALLAGGLLTAGSGGAAGGGVINTGYFNNVAILGYDPVAYFTDNRATEGSPEITYDWLGVTWQFASVEHRDTFAADPIRYAPQFGGLCAGSVSMAQITSNIDPEAWRIVDGRLYLFGGNAGLDVDFDPVAAEVIEKANVNWPTVQETFAAQ